MGNDQGLNKYYANSLEDVIKYVNMVEEDIIGRCGNMSEAMWFRGHEYAHYNLEPNIFRNAEYKYNDNKTYSNNHLREDYRYQHFKAKNYDKTDYREPHSVIEWQEVMQHFFTKTRLMDWSENLFSALEFALEAFLIPYSNPEINIRRHSGQPTVWILSPSLLNDGVYSSMVDEKNLGILEKALDGMETENIKKIRMELMNNKDIYFSVDKKDERKISNIICLAALEDLKKSYGIREREALEKMEINPFFYLLLRIFSDGIPVGAGTIPPLAIIHPYHSQRIKSQKGVFTIFPYYIPGDDDIKIKKMLGNNFNPIAMEYMDNCRNCLYEIQLLNPYRIAEQMREMGFKSSDLYPDSQRVAQDMENTNFYLDI